MIRDKILLKLPIFGSIFNQSVLSKFGKTFGILVGSGISVIDTMNLVKKVVDNRVYELAIEKAAKQIENGSSISDALKLTEIFPGVLIQLMNTGEETGEIDKLAIKVSDFYSKQVDAIVDRLTSIIEPALIILIGVIIGTSATIFGIFLGVTFSLYIENFRQFLSSTFNISLFPEEIYFLSKMPSEIDPTSIFLISICSIIITIIVSIFPAFKAAKLDPIKSLKYE